MKDAGGNMYYGWKLVALSAFCLCFALASAVNYGFSSFVIPLTQTFGWSRKAVSLAYLFSQLGTLAATPVVGRMIDKRNARRVIIPCTVLFGCLMAGLALIPGNLALLYVAYFAAGAIGCGASVLPFSRLVLTWFDRRKGLALALTMIGPGLGAVIIPLLVHSAIAHGGWRAAYMVLGGINILVSAPLLLLLLVNRPADRNLAIDGDAATADAIAHGTRLDTDGSTARQAFRTTSFWILVVAFAMTGFAHMIVMSQLIPIISSQVTDAASAAKIASLMGLAVIFIRLANGALLDRFFAPRIGAAFLLTTAISIVICALYPGPWAAAILAIGIGIGFGCEFDLMPYLIAYYFGRKRHGFLYGLLFCAFVITGGVASYGSAAVYDATRSYRFVLLIAGGSASLGVALLMLLRPRASAHGRTL